MMALNGVRVDRRFETWPSALLCGACGETQKRICIQKLRTADTMCRDKKQYDTVSMRSRSLCLFKPGDSLLFFGINNRVTLLFLFIDYIFFQKWRIQ